MPSNLISTMAKEEKIDDLASLFLPDLLTPIGNYNINSNSKTDETGFLFGVELAADHSVQDISFLPNPSTTDLNFRSSSGTTGGGSAQRQCYTGYGSNSNFDAGFGSTSHHDGHSISYQTYPNQDFGHFCKDSNALGSSIPHLNKQKPNILPIQASGPSFRQLDNILWILQSELLQSLKSMNSQYDNMFHQEQQPFMQNPNVLLHQTEPIFYETNTNARAKKALAPAIPDIQIDYSSNSLLHLLDMNEEVTEKKNYQIFNSIGEPVFLGIKGFLHGRFCTNDLDNYIYHSGKSESIDESRTYKAMVVSCYRRNFINMHIMVSKSSNSQLLIDGERILNLRLEVDAIAQGPEAGNASFTIRDTETDPKDPAKVGDNLTVDVIDKSHILDPKELGSESFFMVKKLKFLSSTINSLKLNSQTYYRLTVSLVADLPSGSKKTLQLKSAPIIVRGRNPSFYNTRKDHLIKPRSPYFRASYGSSERSHRAIRPYRSITDPQLSNSREDSMEESSDSYLPMKAEEASDGCASGSEEDSSIEEQQDKSNDLYIKQILDSIQNTERKNYHYFPVLSVYYTHPVSVVYFPHGAHLVNATADSEGMIKDDRTTPKECTPFAKKLVYFR